MDEVIARLYDAREVLSAVDTTREVALARTKIDEAIMWMERANRV